jgi:hypothetical protein
MKSRVNPELVKLARAAIDAAKQRGLKKRAFVPMSPAGPAPAPEGGAGAPPMDPAMMGGAPPMDPAAGGAPPMDPAAMGGAPPMDPAAGGAPAAPGGEAVTVALPDLIQLFSMVAQQGGAPGGGGANPAPAPESAPADAGGKVPGVGGKGAGKDYKLDMIMSKLDTVIGALGMANMMAPAEGGAEMPPPEAGGENALAPTEGAAPAVDASGAAPPPPAGGGMTVAASMKKIPSKLNKQAVAASQTKQSDLKSRALALSRICSNLRNGNRR